MKEPNQNLRQNWKFNCNLKGPKNKEQCKFKVNLSEYQMNLHKN